MNFAFSSPAENLEAASAAWLRDLEAQGRLSRTVEAYASTLADFTSFFGADEDKSDIPSYAEVLLWRGNLESAAARSGQSLSTCVSSAPSSTGRASMAGIRQIQS